MLGKVVLSSFRRLRHLYAKLRRRQMLPPGIRIGKGVYIDAAARLDWSHGRHITIEDGATLAPGARILCHDASSVRRIGGTWVAPVTIGAEAFIGAEAVIMPGVRVGKGAVVAAGAIVTRDVAPGTIVAGIPARLIGSVVELDAQRRELMSRLPRFPSAEYERDDLPTDKDEQLREALEAHGSYFLV